MYETVKVVNGYEIYRAKGTQRYYYVDIVKGSDDDWKVYRTFHTIKAAARFCETLSAKA